MIPKYQKNLAKYRTHLILLMISLVLAFITFLSLQSLLREIDAIGAEYTYLEQIERLKADSASKNAIVGAMLDQDICSLRDVVCPDEKTVEEQIREVAVDQGFKNADGLVKLAKCESGLDPKRWNETVCPSCRGLYQWHRNSLPDDECALDVACSTKKTIEAVRRGEQWRWPNCKID